MKKFDGRELQFLGSASTIFWHQVDSEDVTGSFGEWFGYWLQVVSGGDAAKVSG